MKFVLCCCTVLACAFAIPCGNRGTENDDRIIGGVETKIQAHPYQVSVRMRKNHICGGSLISAIRVLTAAHCPNKEVLPSFYSIMAGSTMRHSDPKAQIRTISEFAIHPDYNADTHNNDIAVLYFLTPVRWGDFVQKVILPQPDMQIPFGQTANMTGWGQTQPNNTNTYSKRLMVVETSLVTHEACNVIYEGRITNEMLCAGSAEGIRDSCFGDGGGPLVRNGVQLGVMSWGNGCGQSGFPRVYVNVPKFDAWIRDNL